MCFSAYVGIGALVDYAMAKWRTVGPFEDFFTDEKARSLIRAFVCLSAFCLCTLSLMLGDLERALPVVATMKEGNTPDWIQEGMPSNDIDQLKYTMHSKVKHMLFHISKPADNHAVVGTVLDNQRDTSHSNHG